MSFVRCQTYDVVSSMREDEAGGECGLAGVRAVEVEVGW